MRNVFVERRSEFRSRALSGNDATRSYPTRFDQSSPASLLHTHGWKLAKGDCSSAKSSAVVTMLLKKRERAFAWSDSYPQLTDLGIPYSHRPVVAKIPQRFKVTGAELVPDLLGHFSCLKAVKHLRGTGRSSATKAAKSMFSVKEELSELLKSQLFGKTSESTRPAALKTRILQPAFALIRHASIPPRRNRLQSMG
jgi:hypothetical protein